MYVPLIFLPGVNISVVAIYKALQQCTNVLSNLLQSHLVNDCHFDPLYCRFYLLRLEFITM